MPLCTYRSRRLPLPRGRGDREHAKRETHFQPSAVCIDRSRVHCKFAPRVDKAQLLRQQFNSVPTPWPERGVDNRIIGTKNSAMYFITRAHNGFRPPPATSLLSLDRHALLWA